MKAIVISYNRYRESSVGEVKLPEGHLWDNAYPKSKWGHFQKCNKCGLMISWCKIEHKWFIKGTMDSHLLSCEEKLMDEALK